MMGPPIATPQKKGKPLSHASQEHTGRLDDAVGHAPVGRSVDWTGLMVVGVAALYFSSLVPYGFNLGEDGDVLYLIYRTFCGHRPYIDFASGYTPGFFYANAALFHVFGVNVLVIRWALVAVNSLAVFGLYHLARLVVPAALAIVPALGYVAVMLVLPGEYAAFNVPYPAWYVVLTWVASTLALLRGVREQSVLWFAVAGVLAAIGCGFKPNTGAFNLVALVLTVLFCCNARGTTWQRRLWWLALAVVLVTLAAVFRFHVTARDARLLLWPVLALAIVCVMRPGARDAFPFVPALGALLGGFAALTVPWMIYYWMQLGTERFLTDVLFIGSGHLPAFYIPIRAFGLWDAALLGGAGVVVLATWWAADAAKQAQRALRWVAAVTTLLGAFWVWRAPMPEGFVRAVTQQVQYLSFGAAVLAHWAAVWVVARASAPSGTVGVLANGASTSSARAVRDSISKKNSAHPELVEGSASRSSTVLSGERAPAAIAIAVGAPLMYLSIYPRADFFHAVLSAGLTAVLVVMLYWQVARRWVRWPALAATPAYVLIAVLAWPGVSLSARQVTATPTALAHLGVEDAPLVLESGRAGRLDDLRAVTQFITTHSEATGTLLGFPNLQLVNFLSERQVPGRYGSFHPGWPDHIVEAEIVNDLRARRTPLIVMRNDLQLFIGHAPLYFFLLRAYVQQHFQLAARFGHYDVLQRRPAANSPPQVGPRPNEVATTSDCAAAVAAAERMMPERAESLAPCWRRRDAPSLQWRAVRAAQAAHDPGAAQPLAQALAAHTLASSVALFAVRTIGELGNAAAVPAVIAARAAVDGRVRDELDTALFNIASRALVGRFMFVSNVDGEDAVRGDAASGAAGVAWLADGVQDPRLRFAGAWIAGVRAEVAAVAGLRRMVIDPDVGLKAVAADALIRMGVFDDVVGPLLDGLAHDDALLPGLVLAWCQAQPERAAGVLSAAFEDGDGSQREMVVFIAAALGQPGLEGMIRTGVTDPAPRVRMAAIWAAGVLGVDAARAQIEQALRNDPTDQVRRFAQASLEWMSAPRTLKVES